MKYAYKLIAFLSVLSLFWLSPTSAQIINFPDANLAAAVRDELGLGATDPITQTDLDRLVFLNVGGFGITDLTGLEHATNIEVLALGINQIRDFRPLSRLTRLTHLYINNNHISNIGLFSGLTSLTELAIYDNQISDIRPLSRLTNLQALDISENRISDLTPISRLTNLTWLNVGVNPITDLRPLSNLVNLTFFAIHESFEEEYPGQIFQYIAADAQIVFFRTGETVGRFVTREQLSRPKANRKRVVFQRCGLGWSPLSQYGHRPKSPKAMIYALEFEYKQDPRARYICSIIEIRTGDPEITDLNGWKLYLGTLYNQSYVPIIISNAQVTDGVLRLTPDMLGLDEFRCSNAYIYSQAVPSVFYELRTQENITVDRAYSCFLWGQIATTKKNGIWTKSERRISPRALREMDTPRIERYITKPNSVYGTYISLEDFQWDRFVLSDWLLPAPENTPNAPSMSYRKLTTSWAALKKDETQ